MISFRSLPLFFVLASAPLAAQSLSVDTPAPLHPGTNSATVDSFTGTNFWQFTGGPGSFTITILYGQHTEAYTLKGRPTAFAHFRPEIPGATTTQKDIPGGTVFTGNSTKPGIVKIAIVPVPGMLVRQTTPYSIEVTGHATFIAEAASGPSIVGVYSVNIGDHGIAKFAADGSITTANGEHGHWELFDAGSRLYNITIGRDRYSYFFKPTLGFYDSNQSLIISLHH